MNQASLFSKCISGAMLSPCLKYRYRLSRNWDDGPEVCWVMLNPSTADASQDDPTIRRCLAFTRAWGYAGLHVVNLFAFRATDRRELRKVLLPVGMDNDRHIAEVAKRCPLIVGAWGNDGGYLGRAGQVRELLTTHGLTLHALRITKAGEPEHPLYLPGDLRPQVYGEESQ